MCVCVCVCVCVIFFKVAITKEQQIDGRNCLVIEAALRNVAAGGSWRPPGDRTFCWLLRNKKGKGSFLHYRSYSDHHHHHHLLLLLLLLFPLSSKWVPFFVGLIRIFLSFSLFLFFFFWGRHSTGRRCGRHCCAMAFSFVLFFLLFFGFTGFFYRVFFLFFWFFFCFRDSGFVGSTTSTRSPFSVLFYFVFGFCFFFKLLPRAFTGFRRTIGFHRVLAGRPYRVSFSFPFWVHRVGPRGKRWVRVGHGFRFFWVLFGLDLVLLGFSGFLVGFTGF